MFYTCICYIIVSYLPLFNSVICNEEFGGTKAYDLQILD